MYMDVQLYLMSLLTNDIVRTEINWRTITLTRKKKWFAQLYFLE